MDLWRPGVKDLGLRELGDSNISVQVTPGYAVDRALPNKTPHRKAVFPKDPKYLYRGY